ncbi:proliferating cell nuclear antigen [Mucor velutinosus]|uniref:Proliferating cell nuclear antigen n=1 Tax=Mucor velutinosus TaxID=708070 RepID=A0AAN7DBG7_9FUNG|nr:proliferating cell nuclear antigen [Mucor velutinosus]
MCDLTDPRILETYTAIVEDEPTNWLILGYNDTRDVISLYSKGTEGLDEFRNHLSDEVLYGFVRVDDRFILITWVSEQVSGVRRARALVHSRSVASTLKLHHAQLTASTLNDLSDINIRTRLKLGDGNQSSSRRSSASLSQKRLSRRQSTQSPVPPASPTVPSDPVPAVVAQLAQEDEFVEASENFVTPPVSNSSIRHVDEQQQQQQTESAANEARQRQLEEEQRQQQLLIQQQQQQEAEERKRREEQEREAAAMAAQAAEAAAAAEREAKRLAAEEATAKRLEEERLLKEKMEAERLIEEKKMLQLRLLEAEKNKDIVLSGFVSVQPCTSPFWRRRYFTIKGKSMTFYSDEMNPNPITVLDLNNVKRLSNVNIDVETFVPNAFVLETQQNGAYQLFADNRKERDTILTALQTVI